MGSFGHWNLKGSILFFLKAPIHKAFVFFSFNYKLDNTPNELTIFMAFLSDVVSSRIRVVSSANCEFSVFCPLGSSMPRQSWFWRILRASISTTNTNKRAQRTLLTDTSRDFEVITRETRIHHTTD